MPGQLDWIFLTQADPWAGFPREADSIENFCKGGLPSVFWKQQAQGRHTLEPSPPCCQ